jgi:thiamine pyrophosphokinase
VVAADGGANLCTTWGWSVDLVVGDMDSVAADVAEELKAQGVPFHAFPRDKDETDLEIAIRFALERGPDEVFLAGALGARIDHTLGNLALLALPALQALPSRVVDGGQSVWLVQDRLTVQGELGDSLSLIPMGGDVGGVSAWGVHWPLDNADLTLGPSLGISNRLTEHQAQIRVRSGSLLVVHIQEQQTK